MTPGWTTATRFSRSISTIRSIAGERDGQRALDAGRPARQAGSGAARDDRRRAARAQIRTSSATCIGRGRQGDGTRAARPGDRRSRRVDSSRDRSRRSAGGAPGRRSRMASTRRSAPASGMGRGGHGRESSGGRRPRSPGATMASMARARTLVAAMLAVVVARAPLARRSGAGTPPHRCGPSPRRPRRRRSSLARSDRSSLDLDATYRATLKLTWATRSIWVDSTATIRNTSGGRIDRVELNTIAARLGDIRLRPVTVDGAAGRGDGRRPDRSSCRSAASCPPAPTTRSGCGYSARLRAGTSGSDWLFARANGIADLYRWLPWVSRRIAFDRPNHGDPFETPTSSLVRVTVVTDRPAGAGHDRRSSLGQRRRPDPGLRGARRPRLHGHGGHRLPDDRAPGGRNHRPSLVSPGLERRGPASMPRPTRSRRSRPGSDRTPMTRSRSSNRPAGSGWSRPELIWIPSRSSAEPSLPGRPRDRPPVVLRDRRQRPGAGARLPTRRPPTSWRGSSWGCIGPAVARRPGSTCRSTTTRSSCYFETIYIQGGNLLDTARRRMGSTAFWAALRRYVGATGGARCRRPGPSSTRSTTPRRSTLGQRCSRRASRGCTERRQD